MARELRIHRPSVYQPIRAVGIQCEPERDERPPELGAALLAAHATLRAAADQGPEVLQLHETPEAPGQGRARRGQQEARGSRPMRISISGPPGSGKTTICMIVANRLDCNFVLVGQVFRQMASERQMDLATFGKLAEEDETIDRELDERMVEVAKASTNIVLEGRLTGLLLKANNIPVLAVFVTASEQVRAERVAQREGRDAAS